MGPQILSFLSTDEKGHLNLYRMPKFLYVGVFFDGRLDYTPGRKLASQLRNKAVKGYLFSRWTLRSVVIV